MTETKVTYNGQSAELSTPEGEAVVEDAVRGAMGLPERDRQLSMTPLHSEMYERHTLVRNKIQELVEEIGIEGVEVSAAVRVPTQVFTDQGLYDVKTEIKVSMKPAKDEG